MAYPYHIVSKQLVLYVTCTRPILVRSEVLECHRRKENYQADVELADGPRVLDTYIIDGWGERVILKK